MVLCSTCGDAIADDGACPTCGELEPEQVHADPTTRLDEALLFQVGVALAAQAGLAQRRANRLSAESVVLRGRLRTQAVLLRRLMLERPRMGPAVTAALENVETALRQYEARPGNDWRWIVRARLPRDVTCGAVARRVIGEYVREDLDPVPADDALWVVSELANNAFLHGKGCIRLYVERLPDRLRIEVRDEGQPRRIESPAETGDALEARGLLVVDRLSTAWGTVDGTARVWADMAIS
jgi:signal transduction histidine kinase